ncbi:hypothetical protein CAPTEDRAFT_205539 [Capitella teleta]|uniref:Uncharacterized protein n=1 Tax=Capitella teleta TaxID=283909 RepID=R7TXU7_CAPTE|nr:hypothetical protein CAPTEDRAFT_205539 [Capitella teleta]|eukprot:ELT98432.1 hypothetical protein CAPTEDRAFT_205539 [Capitella teleta]
MATKLHSDMNRELWDEVKRVRGNAKDCAGVIDDAVGEDAICDVFASKYEELYSSVSFNADDMVELRRDVDIDIRSKCCEELCYSNHAVTVQDIKEALEHVFIQYFKKEISLLFQATINFNKLAEKMYCPYLHEYWNTAGFENFLGPLKLFNAMNLR